MRTKPALRRDLGSFLSDAPPKRQVSKTVLLRDFLAAQSGGSWFTLSAIAQALTLHPSAITRSISILVGRGDVAEWRRHDGSVYRWVQR